MLTTSGLVRSLVGFIRGTIAMLNHIPKHGLQGIFIKDHSMITSALRSTVLALVSSDVEDIHDEIISLNLLSFIIKDWLVDNTTIPLTIADPGFGGKKIIFHFYLLHHQI